MTKRDVERAYNLYRKRREALYKQIGTKCILCGYDSIDPKDRMTYHEIHFEPHPINQRYYETHIKDFVRLCFKCHQTVHWLHAMYNLSWSEIIKLHKILKKNKNRLIISQ